MMTRSVPLVGGSRGIGLAVAGQMAHKAEPLWCVSRSRSPHGQWVEADLATGGGVEAVVRRLSGERIDALLYLGGTWEAGAFTNGYDFASAPRDEVDRVVAVNLVAPIKLVHGLLPALRRSDDPRCVLVGSLSGLENGASREVANSASKYGLRGAAQALRHELPELAVTVINPGNVATSEVEDDIAAGRFCPQVPIPMPDLVAAIDLALSLSRHAVATEINLAQRHRAKGAA